MASGSKKAVVTAIVANGLVTIIKFVTAVIGGSASMMNEAVHSLMDTLNQAFLLIGLKAAEKPADSQYAFGHGQKKYLWNLWSAIGLFSIGAGLELAHAWHAYHELGSKDPNALIEILGASINPLVLALVVLFIALLIEGYSFLVATREFLRAMREDGYSNPFTYLLKSDDPTLVAVVLEDSVAILGLLFASTGISLTMVTGNAVWDVIFSALIALMLGAISFYLGYVNMRYLTDMRDTHAEKLFAKVASEHKEVERFHDIRSIILDENNTVLVAEVELREEAIVPGLRQQVFSDLNKLMAQVPEKNKNDKSLKDYIYTRAVVQSTLARTEEIIDELERDLKKLAPQVSHITIEVEGIAAAESLPTN